MTPTRRPRKPRGLAEITAEAREHVSDNPDWLMLNEPAIVITQHDGIAEYWVAAWIKVPDND